MIRIGIPRALMYYQFAPLWEEFFRNLEMEPVTTDLTNKRVLDEGCTHVVDEACLPVKVFFGHVAQFKDIEVDYVFVPRMISVEKKAYICPKIMGLPDMLNAAKLDIPTVINPIFNNVSSNMTQKFLWEISEYLGVNKRQVRNAWRKAQIEQNKYEEQMCQVKQLSELGKINGDGNLTILILGHNYNIYDDYLNFNIHKRLKEYGCRIYYPESFSKRCLYDSLKVLPKNLFWTYGRMLLGSALCFSQMEGTKGVIILTSFGCGIDSFIDNMVMRYLNKENIPYLNLVIDEHTGEAGVITRLEAFLDMIRWRWINNEGHLSSHGDNVGSSKGYA